MKLDLVFPKLPPSFDGIGDYTSHLARALAEKHHDVRIWTAQANSTPIPGVRIERAFSLSSRRAVSTLASSVAADPPDWLVLQYNPFSYGRWGLNLSLIATFREIRRRCPKTQIALMVHEPFVPIESWRFALFTTWQRWQLWRLGRIADLVFFSIAPWVERFQSWFPNTPLALLPVGSNMPLLDSNRTSTRTALDISDDTLVFGIFGSAHESRDLSLTRAALQSLQNAGLDVCILYVGTSGTTVRSAVGGDQFIDAGPLPADDVSHHLSAMDVYLAPFRDGVSTRRGSFMAGLQHGIPTVTTTGPDTGPTLRSAAGTHFLASPRGDTAAFTRLVRRLATNETLRHQIGTAGATFYAETYDWPHIREQMTSALDATSHPPTRDPAPSVSSAQPV